MGDNEQDSRHINALNRLMNRAFWIGFLAGFFTAAMVSTVVAYIIYSY